VPVEVTVVSLYSPVCCCSSPEQKQRVSPRSTSRTVRQNFCIAGFKCHLLSIYDLKNICASKCNVT